MVIEKLIKYHYGGTLPYYKFDGFTTLGWIIVIYLFMVVVNVMRLAVCRCGAISKRGLLISFIPPVIVDILLINDKFCDWYSNEEHS